ncbi:MAG: response regulator transcription factor [Chitinophagaceae bacterium]|nr:MAG: response regulator transcription factor [Chitinophagaceae bacterium]
MKILIIEDEKAISDSISDYLESEQFFCERASNYKEALHKLSTSSYACILLDIGLPGGSGLGLIEYLKNEGRTDGILIITAKNSLDDKVNGLNDGADDYLTKPFHLAELAARVMAIIRRKAFDGKNTITCNNLLIDLKKKTASVNDRLVDLTKKEYDLLLYFLSNKNKVISKNAIAEHLWGNNTDLVNNYDFLYTHIKNMRKKLIWAGCEDYVRSVYGMGYKFQQHD